MGGCIYSSLMNRGGAILPLTQRKEIEMEKVNPITIRFEGGETYTLEFNRKTVAAAERAGVVIGDASDRLMTTLPELFFYAFKMHHPSIKREKTDKILFDDLGGLSEAQMERLIDLYEAPYEALMNEGEDVKNPNVTVTL